MAVVEVEVAGDVAIITLARPEKLNAINDEMLDGLLDAIETVGRSEAIGAVVLIGRGRAFSAGGDIAAMDGMDDRTFADTISRYMRLSAAFRACPKPIVAAIHGYALAGGFELALMCDVRFAAEGTQFGLPDTPLGLSPTSGMTWLLPRVVGLGRAMYLTLSGGGHRRRGGRADRPGQPGHRTATAAAEAFAHRIAPTRAWRRLDQARVPSRPRTTSRPPRREEAGELACFQSPDTRERFRDFVDRKRG